VVFPANVDWRASGKIERSAAGPGGSRADQESWLLQTLSAGLLSPIAMDTYFHLEYLAYGRCG
jgi:hypothetical protein